MGVPSHTPFPGLIDYCVRGHTHPDFQNSYVDDHIAEIFMLKMEDTDHHFWWSESPPEGKAMHGMIRALTERISSGKDLAAAELLYSIATYAAFEVLNLFLRDRDLFDQITPKRKLLPMFASIHPGTAKVMVEMEKAAHLGTATDDARRIRSKAWFTSDAPANVYARAVITCIEMNRRLDSLEVQQQQRDEIDRKEKNPPGQTRVLPYPKYVGGLDDFPVPITPGNVMDYWRKGKEIILEEMPDFHLRPEWESYRRRTYKNGAKPGSVQHAIFKDILAALKTIAGGNRTRAGK